MKYEAASPDEYVSLLPGERQEVISKLRDVIKRNLPEGFIEEMNYGMIGYVIPHELYPGGYHCDPSLPLPFMNIASQKNYVAVYHMGIYAKKELLDWFMAEYPKHTKAKLDMGKSCIRFKKTDDVPYELIGQLAGKVSAQEWIDWYEQSLKK